MRGDAVTEFLNKAKADWSAVNRLIEWGIMVKKTFRQKTFYARKLLANRNNEIPGFEAD